MDRKEFLRNGLLATGAVLLPNAIWAFKKNFNVENRNLNKFVSKPNLHRFKVSELGIKFFETELNIFKNNSKFKLIRKYFVSECTKGLCTPTLLETNKKESFVFIPELYKENKHNGFIVKVCENGICEEQKIFTHENQGFYAFWGKEYLGNPTLYHYNLDTFHLMRMHLENEQWINHRVMPINPNEMNAIYEQQLRQVTQGKLTQQYGYDFEIHKDGFYQFLSLKHGWEQGITTKEKDEYEEENPAKIFTENINIQSKIENFDGYTNPFVPIWCEGDDTSHAIIKPTVFYKEIEGTKIEIPNMPAYKTQDDIGDCKAFSLAVLLQHYTCEKWKSDIPDCKNPPADSAISYFGLMAYTNQVPNQENTFQPDQEEGKAMDVVIDDLSKSGNRLILEGCKSSEIIVKEFSLNGSEGLDKRDAFFKYLKNLYEKLKNKNESEIKDCTAEVDKLNAFVDLKFNATILKKAFTKNDFDHFLYELFFSNCMKENFPSGFRAAAFPLDSMNATPIEVKAQILKGLKFGKPVLFPSLCVSQDNNNECKSSHSLVISGFKKVKNKRLEKDVFKVHNSWGLEWQKKNNDGWVDADIICHNTVRSNSGKGYRIDSGSVIWLAP